MPPDTGTGPGTRSPSLIQAPHDSPRPSPHPVLPTLVFQRLAPPTPGTLTLINPALPGVWPSRQFPDSTALTLHFQVSTESREGFSLWGGMATGLSSEPGLDVDVQC